MAVFRELFQYKYLLYSLVIRDIKKKYRRSVLGLLWSMLNPLLMMMITSMVFSTLFRFDVPNYILYLLIGQVVFAFYAEATNFAMGSILENGGLIKKVYVPKYMFPLARVVSSCVNLIFTLPAIVFMMCYTGQYPGIQIFFIIVPIVLMLLFCLGVGLALSAAVVYFRDLYHLYGVLITALNYATPIFYPESIVPETYKFLLLFNPLYYYLKAFRYLVYKGELPNNQLLLICTGMSIIAVIIGAIVFQKAKRQFVLYV